MSQAIADPEELRRFSTNLRQFNHDLEGCVNRVRGQFQHLSSSWRDTEYQKFAEIFDRTVEELRRYVQTSEAFIPVLEKKAQFIEDYQRQGFGG